MRREPFFEYLLRLPRLRRGAFVHSDPAPTYQALVQHLDAAGYWIAARDDRMLRLCAYKFCRAKDCTCLHVFWVRRTGTGTYVSYGIEPRFWSFLFCRRSDHLLKLTNCQAIIRAAVELATSTATPNATLLHQEDVKV